MIKNNIPIGYDNNVVYLNEMYGIYLEVSY